MKKIVYIVLPLINLLSATGVRAELTEPKLNHQLNKLSNPHVAPKFSLEDMDGNIYSISDLKGKVVIVNFWTTWCPPCRREMPSMEYLYQEFKDKNFTVLAINQWESPDHVFAFMGELDVFPNFPILFDTKSTVSADYGIKGLPTTLLINKQGKIVYQAVGGRDFNHPDIKNIVQELIDTTDEN